MKHFYCEKFQLWPENRTEIQDMLRISLENKELDAEEIHIPSWIEDKLIKVEIIENLYQSYESFKNIYKDEVNLNPNETSLTFDRQRKQFHSQTMIC